MSETYSDLLEGLTETEVPAPDALPTVLTLADLDAQIAQTQAVVAQQLNALMASETYQAYIRMSGGLDALKAMRVLLNGGAS